MTSQTALSGIDACLFDAYGTLFDVHRPIQRLADGLGPNASDISVLWRQKQVQYTWLRSLMGAYTGFAQVTADALDHALNAFGISDNDLRRELLDLYQTLDTYPEVPASLEKLRRLGVTTGVLSNGETGMIESAARAAGIRDNLEHILSADSAGIFKPHERVYQLAVDRLELSPQRICFVSANAWDVAGAANFGYTVVWVNRFDQPPENLPGTPFGRIGSLDHLPPLLRNG